ncbi:FGGY-family carbohydrate kinase [Aestuariivirga litoralis]|uniref:FGGY-family carbohydrate kinase n=1 Tax=Aestuariivirga litoralis TaxID=2650924 RepID=UPI0018C7D890|nr:FGGY-family carbohydrate kinase [Aestuariivirga litoralis]MBG1232342.1 carbohydrate kinase [Aestuariivirga litoralis]
MKGSPHSASGDVIIGVDAGTSVIKAVAFDLEGRQLDAAAIPNRYHTGQGGAVTQSLEQTYLDCAQALRNLGSKIPNLATRTIALAVTGQGDGTWLVGKDNKPVGDAWLWLDARAAPTVERLAASSANRARFELTGTGLNTCQQGTQLAHMLATAPDLLARAEVALHCKDWLFLNLTGTRATDPSEASFTFGDFRTRQYNDDVLEALGLSKQRHLLPPIVEGSETTFPLTADAAKATGLRPGIPVTLAYVDMAMTAFGAGVYTGDKDAACSVIGSTGVHMRAVKAHDVFLNDEGTGYVIPLPSPGIVTQVQTNMAATLNLDWVLRLGQQVLQDFGQEESHGAMVAKIDGWLARTKPGALLYHPYISEAGERGPFVDAAARAQFTGLSSTHSYADLVRAVIEGLGLAMRDCYAMMGDMPKELRITGGAARSAALRQVLSAAVNAPVRVSAREEAGAAGAAIMAAVAVKAYPNVETCIAKWVTPLLGAPEAPDAEAADIYRQRFEVYRKTRVSMLPIWKDLAALPHEKS